MKTKIITTKKHKDIELQLCLLHQTETTFPKEVIKLDFDHLTKNQFLKTLRDRRAVLWFFKLQIIKLKVCTTNHGYHIYITVNKKINNKDLVFIQVALGSDIYRECFYWKRIKYPILPNKGWNILFQKKHYNTGKIGREKESKYLTNKIYKIMTNTEKPKKKKKINKVERRLKKHGTKINRRKC